MFSIFGVLNQEKYGNPVIIPRHRLAIRLQIGLFKLSSIFALFF
jgi:hypothetical protein